mmetsp:Transcript_148444/g.258940  ORF Transcript_148444/g.258940 Transcript_148444/m.258940 type:complete len:235 (-) Transcript_148444:505-1209(-)
MRPCNVPPKPSMESTAARSSESSRSCSASLSRLALISCMSEIMSLTSACMSSKLIFAAPTAAICCSCSLICSLSSLSTSLRSARRALYSASRSSTVLGRDVPLGERPSPDRSVSVLAFDCSLASALAISPLTSSISSFNFCSSLASSLLACAEAADSTSAGLGAAATGAVAGLGPSDSVPVQAARWLASQTAIFFPASTTFSLMAVTSSAKSHAASSRFFVSLASAGLKEPWGT